MHVNSPVWADENQPTCEKVCFLLKMSEIYSRWVDFNLYEWTLFKSVNRSGISFYCYHDVAHDTKWSTSAEQFPRLTLLTINCVRPERNHIISLYDWMDKLRHRRFPSKHAFEINRIIFSVELSVKFSVLYI